jgi:hypothetical protein
MKLPDRETLTRVLARRRNQVLLGVLLLLVIVRIALPYVLRSVIVSQADAALIGRVELADVDLSLIRGGVALEGLSVHVDERPSTEPALFEAKRLWTQISWLALFTKTIEIEEFELDGFVVRLDRYKEGLVLPKPVPSTEPPEPEPENPEPLGWSFAANSVAFRDGEIHVRDYTIGKEPQQIDLAVHDLSAQKLALRIDPTGQEPGRLVIQAQLDQGSVGLDAQITQTAKGPGATSTITLTNLPIGKGRRYLALFGWSELTGTLDAVIEHRIEPGGLHQVSGTASLSDIEVTVPNLDGPALAWKKLAIELDEVDLQKQSAIVAEVALVGARVVVDPRSKEPLPVLVKPEPAEAEADDEDAAKTDVDVKVTEPPTPWTWSVRKARVNEAVIDLRGAPEPLELALDAEMLSISSEKGSRWPLTLSLKQGAGSLGVDGGLVVEPLAFDGKLSIADLALAPLLAQIDAPAVNLLRKGNARADLQVALAKDLRVSGKLGVAGLDVGDEKTARDFGVAWKDFELGIREVTLPDVLAKAGTTGPRTIGVKLDLVRLVEPSFIVTRTEDGIVLPSFGTVPVESAESGAPEAPPAETEAEPASASSPAPEIQVDVARARIEAARAQIADRAVKPFYRTKIERLDLNATGIRWPGTRVADLKLTMKGMQGATLDVSGSVGPGNSKVTAKLVKLPLAQFNPYVTPTGYGLSDGALSLESTATIEDDVYQTSTDLEVSQLGVGGSEGESLFQQNFGIPLSVALGLLKDLDGNITMAVPVDGDRGGVKVGLGSIVGQALRKALMGALASPLKLLGAVTADGKVQSLAPAPIEFVPGEAALAPAGAERVEQIAGLLSSSPGISLTLSGVTSESDLRVLRERALHAELEATSGLRALGEIGEIGTRRAVRHHLGDKLAGKTPEPLEPDAQAWLETHVAEQEIDPAALATLASARASAAQALLTGESGIAVSRVPLGPPATEPPAALPGVAIALGAIPASPAPAP